MNLSFGAFVRMNGGNAAMQSVTPRLAVLGCTVIFSGSLALASGLEFSLQDADGTTHTAAELSRSKATVFIFVATDCPNSNTYAPVLARLYREYSPRGVAFLNVYSDPAESASSVSRHDTDFQTPFRALLDPH